MTYWLALIPFRRSADQHWTERARLLWPARVAASWMVRVLPADLVLGQQLLWPELSPPWPLAVLAAWPGAVASWYSFDHETRPWMTSQEYACGECLAPIIAPKWLLKWN